MPNMTLPQKEAYDNGYKSYVPGALVECPYIPFSSLWQAYWEGYNRAVDAQNLKGKLTEQLKMTFEEKLAIFNKNKLENFKGSTQLETNQKEDTPTEN